jgi:ABC-type transporter MlaC component
MRGVARGWTMFLLSAVWLSALGLATAGEPTDLVRQITDQVLKILEDPQFQAPNRHAERQERLHKIAEQVFDWQEMARRALAVHWRERTPQEQQEFVRLFRDLVEGISLVNNYRSQFNRIITSSSYNDLVQKMKTRQGDELSGSPQRKVQ